METKLKVKIIAHTNNLEEVIACAGKLCYSKVGVEQLLEKQSKEDIERFVNMLVSLGHESPLEHASITFAIEGVSRALTHQLVRHRLASYSQQSQRYVKEDQFEYVIPKDIKRNKACYDAYVEHMLETQRTYDFIVDNLLFDYLTHEEEIPAMNRLCKKNKLERWNVVDFIKELMVECLELDVEDSELELVSPHELEKELTMDNKRLILSKILEKYPKLINALIKRAIENARYVLPNAAETKIVVTMNLRSLINFCKHRVCRRAQEEIRELALAMIGEVEKISPLLSKCLGAPCQFGACPEGAMCCGAPYERKVKLG